MSDDPTSPAHYHGGREYEPWDAIKDWQLDYDLGCVVKYISRAGRKGARLPDLLKARAYLEHAIRWEAAKHEAPIPGP